MRISSLFGIRLGPRRECELRYGGILLFFLCAWDWLIEFGGHRDIIRRVLNLNPQTTMEYKSNNGACFRPLVMISNGYMNAI